MVGEGPGPLEGVCGLVECLFSTGLACDVWPLREYTCISFLCSCTEMPWSVCSSRGLSHGREVPVGGTEGAPLMTNVVEAMAKLEMPDTHSEECLDALKQFLCLSHFSPCEGGNKTAPGRPACSQDCTELFTGKCQDTWEAYLSYVIQESGLYRDHIEGCAQEANSQDCAHLFLPSPTPTETTQSSATPTETTQSSSAAPVSLACT